MIRDIKKRKKPPFVFICSLENPFSGRKFDAYTGNGTMDYRETIPDRPVCLECGDEIVYGRRGKKFCSDSCKNAYHNRMQHHSRSVRLRIMGILDRNYSVLDRLIKLKISSVSLGDLAQMGYNKEFVTSYHKVGGHDEYRCFDIKYCCSSTRIFHLERVGQGED